MVAHRLSTVQSASEVVVISHGTIAERGTHTELLHKGEEAYASAATQAGQDSSACLQAQHRHSGKHIEPVFHESSAQQPWLDVASAGHRLAEPELGHAADLWGSICFRSCFATGCIAKTRDKKVECFICVAIMHAHRLNELHHV